MGNQTNSLPKLSHSTFWLFSHFVVVQSPSQIQLFATHGLQHAMLPCPILSPRVFSDSCPLSWWCHPTILSSVTHCSSCPQSFPASESFPMSQFFASSGQSIGASASASVFPMNIQGWFPLGLTGCISLLSKELSRVFSNTTVQKCQFFIVQISHPYMTDYWKNHSFDYMGLCQQDDVSDF